MSKLCECGCGLATRLASRTRTDRGDIEGQPVRFLFGHAHPKSGPLSHQWKGGRRKYNGYTIIYNPSHRLAKKDGYVFEHVAIADKALNGTLPPLAIIHHHNEIKHDNGRGNLVICENRAYHNLLHARMRAFKATGNANAIRCICCRRYEMAPSSRISYRASNKSWLHLACINYVKKEQRSGSSYATAISKLRQLWERET
jgi:hypothetical protein